MLTAVAFVPSPPAFVPQLMGRAAHELDGLRTAADAALGALVDALLAADRRGERGPTVRGAPARGMRRSSSSSGRALPPSTRPPGRSGSASSASRSTCRRCPAARRCAPGLCRRPSSSGATSPAGSPAARRRSTASGRRPAGSPPTPPPGAALGAELAASPVPTGLLLLADGAACHGPKAPRAEDSRAVAYEEAVNDALAAGDPAALAALDPHLGAELSATGPELWPLLSAAASGADWSGELLHSDAPYGVGWSVAVWRRAPADVRPIGASSVARGA